MFWPTTTRVALLASLLSAACSASNEPAPNAHFVGAGVTDGGSGEAGHGSVTPHAGSDASAGDAYAGDGGADDAIPPGPAPPVAISLTRLETVLADVERAEQPSGAPGNSWGGQQSRVVRLKDGTVYTAYLAPPPNGSSDPSQARWVLLKRDAASTGTWHEVARRHCGREPMHLLRAPDDTLEVFSWPGTPVSYRITPSANDAVAGPTSVPGNWEMLSGASTPYSGAGIGRDGAVCFIASRGDANTMATDVYTADSAFDYACRAPNGVWSPFTSMPIGLRFAYPYVTMQANGGWTLGATRDIRWEAAGYTAPQGAFAYLFDRVDVWSFPSLVSSAPTRKEISTTVPTPSGGVVSDMVADTLVDHMGRLHVLSHSYDAAGQWHMLHTIVEANGTSKKQAINVPNYTDMALRLAQDEYGRFFLFAVQSNDVYVFSTTDNDGLVLGPMVSFSSAFTAGGTTVVRPAFLSTTRGGTPRAGIVDMVLEIENAGARRLAYARIALH